MSGCVISTTNNEEIINEVKKEILGKNIASLYSKWGRASSKDTLPSLNGVIYVWRNAGCKSIVTTDNAGIITDFSVTGDCALSK